MAKIRSSLKELITQKSSKNRKVAIALRKEAYVNVRSLAADVELLYANGRRPRAIALATLCVEEWSKFIVLDAALDQELSGKKVEWPTFFKELRKHEVKLSLIFTILRKLPGWSQESDDKLTKATQRLGGEAKVARRMNQLKLQTLYSDVNGKTVTGPEGVVKKEQLEGMMSVVRGVINILDGINWDL